MYRFLVHWFAITVALAAAAYVLPGVHVGSVPALLVGSLVLGMVNAIVRPLMTWLTLPLTILTLGLFFLVVNGAAFALAAWVVPGFSVDGAWSALFGALFVSVMSSFIAFFLRESPKRDETSGG